MAEEKRDIGRRVYEHEIDRKEAADRLGVSGQTINDEISRQPHKKAALECRLRSLSAYFASA